MLSPDTLLQALQHATDPLTGKDFAASNAIRNLSITNGDVAFDVAMGYPTQSQEPVLRTVLTAAAQSVPGVNRVSIHFTPAIVAHAVRRGVALLPGVKNVIAVASGKGGVGKSTLSVNLALALAAEGARVGLMDADIYGPSLALMMGVAGRPASPDGKTMEALENHGVQVMSMALLVEPDAAMIWRGPMAVQALEQLLRQTRWQDLDYLFVDLPPGTGDIHLSLTQKMPVTGAVIVTTPQDIALADAQRGATMFAKVDVPVVGLVENMAMHVCSQCGHVEHIFGEGGGARMAAEHGLAYLGMLPLDIRIREHADSGAPTVVAEPDGDLAARYRAIAVQVAAHIAALPRDYSSRLAGIAVARG